MYIMPPENTKVDVFFYLFIFLSLYNSPSHSYYFRSHFIWVAVNWQIDGLSESMVCYAATILLVFIKPNDEREYVDLTKSLKKTLL